MLRTHLLLLSSTLTLAPGLAVASSVCVAKPNTPIVPSLAVGESEPVGYLDHRQCFGVLSREGDKTRILAKGGGFQAEAELPDDALLYELAEDIPMTLKEGEEPWGLALAGTGVAIEKVVDGGWVVATVDGRVTARFLVEEGAMLPASSWPSLDPDEVHPGGKWPKAEHPLPPTAVALSGKSGTRASVSAPLFALDDVLTDPAIGALRYSVVDADAERPERVRIVGPTFWVVGTVQDIDWRRESLAVADDGDDYDEDGVRDDFDGWDDVAGYAVVAPSAPAPREIASKTSPLAFEAKGERFADLAPGARVSVLEEDKPWLKIEHSWDGGVVRGWVDKKRLVKEGKESAAPAVPLPKATVVKVGEATVEWVDKGPEFKTDKEGEPVLDKDGAKVIDENETHVEGPEYEVAWLRRALRDRTDRLRFFYGQLLSRKSTAAGTMTLSLVIAEGGTVALEEPVEDEEKTKGAPEEEPKPLLEWEVTGIDDEDLIELVQTALDEVPMPPRKLKKSRRDKKDYRLKVGIQVTFAPLNG